MYRIIATTGGTIAGIVLLLSLKPHQPPATTTATGPSAPGPTGAQGTTTQKKPNGTFTGDSIQTRYGPVQVSITVRGGKLTGVTVLRVPDGNGRDREIAGFSLPRLEQEALAAGNAKIDTVSGATYTSEGYVGSLQSALDRAGV